MNQPSLPFSRLTGEGRTLPTPAGGRVTFKVQGNESSGSLSIFEFEIPPGAGPRLHVHEEREESIFVLRGELEVQLGDELHQAAQGATVFIPRGVQHRFRNVSDDHAVFLGIYSPGGIEEFFENFAATQGEGRPENASD